mgnify:CR=1 FL=1
MDFIGILSVASLFGGMLLFSAGFGALSFKFLEGKIARKFVRDTFPYFYLWVLLNSLVAAIVCWFVNTSAFIILMIIFLTTIPNRQVLMPAINDAADRRNTKKFRKLHSFSVLITLAHIVLSGICLGYVS